MPLFFVQDLDRPMYVIASDFGEAQLAWTAIVSRENPDETIEPPQGILMIEKDDRCIVLAPGTPIMAPPNT